MKPDWMVLSLISVSAACLGVAGGYHLAEKKLEQKYADLSSEEIAEAKRFYSLLNKTEFETPAAAVEALIPEDPERDEAIEALRNYQGIAMDTPTSGVLVDSQPIDETDYDNDFDYEEEVKLRSSDAPYIITKDEFFENDPENEQSSVTYFVGDDTISDERDETIDDIDGTVGEDNLLKFGYGSGDSNVLYVRNEKLGLDFEVNYSTGKYVEQVLGFIEHSDRRHTKIRKFRGDDE